MLITGIKRWTLLPCCPRNKLFDSTMLTGLQKRFGEDVFEVVEKEGGKLATFKVEGGRKKDLLLDKKVCRCEMRKEHCCPTVIRAELARIII